MRTLRIAFLALLGLFYGGCSVLGLLLILSPKTFSGDEVVVALLFNFLGFIFAASCVWGIVRLLR